MREQVCEVLMRYLLIIQKDWIYHASNNKVVVEARCAKHPESNVEPHRQGNECQNRSRRYSPYDVWAIIHVWEARSWSKVCRHYVSRMSPGTFVMVG
jgi:hypothetical protein